MCLAFRSDCLQSKLILYDTLKECSTSRMRKLDLLGFFFFSFPRLNYDILGNWLSNLYLLAIIRDENMKKDRVDSCKS